MIAWVGFLLALRGKNLWDCYKIRVQERLYKLVDEAPPNLRVSIASEKIGKGLEEQINMALKDFPNTKLIIIDTFQKVRNAGGAVRDGTSADELENSLNSSAEKYFNTKEKINQLTAQIETINKLIEDSKLYFTLLEKDFLTAEEKTIYRSVLYIEQKNINSLSDVTERELRVKGLMQELATLTSEAEKEKGERDYISNVYKIYKRDMAENPYAEIQQLETDQEEREEQQQENNYRKYYCEER